jgi:hypothetical protein
MESNKDKTAGRDTAEAAELTGLLLEITDPGD